MKPEDVQHGRTSQRWAFLEGLDVGADGDPYLDRLRLIQTPWFGLYLHHIHRPDVDPDPHDHPWTFASLVLTGGYREIVWPDKRRNEPVVRDRPRWSVRWMRRASAHMIINTYGLLWTLVLTGPRQGGPDEAGGHWGFWTPAGYVPWRQYVTRPLRGIWIDAGKGLGPRPSEPCGCPSLWPCPDTCQHWRAAHPPRPGARDSR